MVVYYAFQDAIKEVIRTKGIILTTIGNLFLSGFTFFMLHLALFFSFIRQGMLWEAEHNIEEAQFNTPYLLPIAIFAYSAVIITGILFIMSLLNMKKNIKLFSLTQKEEHHTMLLLGQTPRMIQLYIAFKLLIFSIFILSIGSIIGFSAFNYAILHTAQSGLFEETILSYQPNLLILIILPILGIIYLFLTSFITKKPE